MLKKLKVGGKATGHPQKGLTENSFKPPADKKMGLILVVSEIVHFTARKRGTGTSD